MGPVRKGLLHYYAPNEFSPIDPTGPSSISVEMWGKIDEDSLAFHRVGTTSLVVKCRVRSRPGTTIALKLLLYPYTRIDPIAESTSRYSEVYAAGANPWVVDVYSSCPAWIMMEFVDGPTLREALDLAHARVQLPDSTADSLRLDFFELYGSQLMMAVESLSASGMAHEDLTPSNIVLRTRPDQTSELVLIDLGKNYLFTRRIGVVGNDDSRFVAPEVRRDEARSPDRSDIYSIGMLLAAMFDPSAIADGVVPNTIYAFGPALARIIEDLIDANPERRLVLFAAPNLRDVRIALVEEVEALKRQSKNEKVLGRRQPWFELLNPSSREVSSKFKEWRQVRRSLAGVRQPLGYLLGWSVVASANWALVFAVCFLWGIRDFDLANFNLYFTIAQKITGSDDDTLPFFDALRAPGYETHDWQVNFVARVVGFTTALAQTKYYQNIFSRLYPFRIGGPLAFMAEVSVRLVTVCTLVPVLVGNLVQPRWTLILLAAGNTFIGINNLVFYLLLIRTFRAAREVFSTIPEENTSMRSFSQWWSSQLIYAFVIAVIATGLQFGLLRDVWAYVFLVCVVNVFVFYVSKCIVLAPQVRALLSRGMVAGERARLVARADR